MNRSSALLFPTAVFCLLFSGAAGLVYQVAWMRYLSLFLGHTSYAVVAVLVAFMGGLALGNAWLGARADRVRRPLALYAWLELGIAAYAVFFPFYFDACDEAYVRLARSWQPGGTGLLGLKFAFSLLTILLPTVLMGGTLPVMTRLVTRSLGELRERVSRLYFINSAGAVAGCFAADFWWIPTIGLQGTMFTGAALNFGVGAIALFLSGWIREEKTAANASPDSQKHSSEVEEVFTSREMKLAVVGIGVSGFVAMLYEVVWTRMLALALGSSTHAFSVMLITFITGIAVGAWIVGRWKNLRRTLDAFGWAELALAATLLVSMFFYARVPYWFMKLAAVLARRAEAYPLYELVQALICFGVMFIPTVCLGMTLPLVSRIATAELARTGQSVGKVFSVNTLGTVFGAAVTGLWLLPWLGLASTLALGIGLNAGIAALVLSRSHPESRRWAAILVPVGSVAFVIVAGLQFDDTWRRAFTLGLWRGDALISFKTYRERIGDMHHAYYRDGAGSTVSVERGVSGGKETLALRVNGKPEASTTMDVVTQLLLGHIPMLLRLDAKQALVVGLGSGMTGGAVMRHPGVERLDIVEISPEVAQAARLFSAHNDGVLDNPRVRVVLEDAKSFLRTTDRKYDVIISEPSNPWMAGVAAVFSLEYYDQCRARLNPGGVMAQWVQMYESDDATLQIVLKTFNLAFPVVSVWKIATGDLLLLGSNAPFSVDFNSVEQRMSQPGVKADLERIDLFRLPVLLALETISPENAPFIAAPSVAAHSDFYPVLEYAAQRAFFVRNDTAIPHLLDENMSARSSTLLGRYLQSHKLAENDYKAFALFQTTHRIFQPALFRSLLKGWQVHFPQSILALELSAKTPGTPDELESARLGEKREEIFQEAARNPDLLRLYAQLLSQTYAAQRSVFYLPPGTELESALQRLIETDPSNQRIYKLRLAGLAWDRQEDDACLRLAQSGFDPDVKSGGPANFALDPRAAPRTLARMIDIYLRRGDLGAARTLCQQARAKGFVGTGQANSDLLLEITCSKVEAVALQATAQASPGRATP